MSVWRPYQSVLEHDSLTVYYCQEVLKIFAIMINVMEEPSKTDGFARVNVDLLSIWLLEDNRGKTKGQVIS